MTLADDYASRIAAVADRVARLGPDRRNPHSFHESKDDVEQDLRRLANQIEIDQVFAARNAPEPTGPERELFQRCPRTIVDRKGRSVPVETRRRVLIRA